SLVIRFRAADWEERQQIRWLVYVAALGGVLMVGVFVSGIGADGGQSSRLNDLFFTAFFSVLGIGIPAAIGVALLKYRLYAVGLAILPLWRIAARLADKAVYGGRAKPYEVLAEFSQRMAQAYSTDDVLPRMADALATGTGAETAQIWVRVGGQIRPTASWPD